MRAHSPFPMSADPLVPGLDQQLDSDSPAGAEPAPANRAARRGRAKGQVDQGAVRNGSPHRPRAAQGRRVNPVRRTG